MSQKRICLWSGPRNVSTAFMYSFAQRNDTVVYDEPLYGAYLKKFPKVAAYHPGSDEIMESMECDAEKVVQMMLADQSRPIAFFKQMVHHLEGLDWSFLNQMQNLMLIREPKDMLISFDKVIQNPSLQDVGYGHHLKLLRYLQKQNLPIIVVDSKRLLENPAQTLKKLCEKLEIPFAEKMLSWEKGARVEDGCWARYWYANVHQSQGFAPYRERNAKLPDHLKPLYLECLEIYKELSEYAL